MLLQVNTGTLSLQEVEALMMLDLERAQQTAASSGHWSMNGEIETFLGLPAAGGPSPAAAAAAAPEAALAAVGHALDLDQDFHHVTEDLQEAPAHQSPPLAPHRSRGKPIPELRRSKPSSSRAKRARSDSTEHADTVAHNLRTLQQMIASAGAENITVDRQRTPTCLPDTFMEPRSFKINMMLKSEVYLTSPAEMQQALRVTYDRVKDRMRKKNRRRRYP
jgi:hypothetical protein